MFCALISLTQLSSKSPERPRNWITQSLTNLDSRFWTFSWPLLPESFLLSSSTSGESECRPDRQHKRGELKIRFDCSINNLSEFWKPFYFYIESFSVKSPHNTSEVECKKSYLYAVEISWDKAVILIFGVWTQNVQLKKK